MTSIGNGVELGHNAIAGVSGYDSTALIVFTDGEENTAKFIRDVQALINNRVFAVGLGTINEINPLALNQLVSNTGGYLLLTDNLGPSDIFKLQKYFVQILASATTAQVVVDPDGHLPPRVEARIPFDLTEADYTADAMLLSPAPWAFDFALETPSGTLINHLALGGTSGIRFQQTTNLALYRLDLPVLAAAVSAQAGRWQIVLRVAPAGWKEYQSSQGAASRSGVPYSAVVHTRSSVRLYASVTQTSHVPGSTLHLHASLTEMDLPVDHRAQVIAEVAQPGASTIMLPLTETSPGRFEAATLAATSGIYPVHFRAVGRTLRGFPFTREQLCTGMAWAGGDAPPPRGKPHEGVCCHDWAGYFECLLHQSGLRELLQRNHIDPDAAAKCVRFLRPPP